MHSTRTSTALFGSVHAIAVYIGFQCRIKGNVRQNRSFNRENLGSTIGDVHRMFELANVSTVHATERMVRLKEANTDQFLDQSIPLAL